MSDHGATGVWVPSKLDPKTGEPVEFPGTPLEAPRAAATKTQRLAVMAPVGDDRGWSALAQHESVRAQTRQPDEYCFLINKGTHPAILDQPWSGEVHTAETRLPFHNRDARSGDPLDPCRATKFSRLRNELRTLALQTDADVFLSLDTDILLDDPTTIERLLATIADGWDVAAPLTYLHPRGEESQCYNAGFWRAGDPGDPKRIWERATVNDVASRESPVRIQVPMAVYAIRRHALAMCAYKFHESGEDLGFADNLDRHKFRCAWLTDVRVRHVWNESYL